MKLKQQHGAAPGRARHHFDQLVLAKIQGGQADMDRKEIIFFDELGFGWVVDRSVIKKIHADSRNEDVIVEKALADLLRCN